MSRVKNEAVLDRLRRLQEGRAERERQAVDVSAISALAQEDYPPRGHFSKTINDCTRGAPLTSSVNGMGAADRAALLRASRTAPSDSVVGSGGMRESAVHQQQSPSTSIYRTHDQQLRTTPKRSNAYVMSDDRHEEDFGDDIGSHLGNGGCAPTPRGIGTPTGVPQRRDPAARGVPKRTLLAETPSRVGTAPNAIRRGMASPAASRRSVAKDGSPQSKPQWVGSSNVQSKATGTGRGGVTPPPRSSSRSPVGLNRTIVRRGAPEASPRTTSTFGRTPRKLVEVNSGPIVYTPGSRNSQSGRDRSPGAKRLSLSPNLDVSRGNVSMAMANPSRISRGPQNTSTNPRKTSARTAEYQRSSSLADYDSMGAYEYSDAVDRGTRPSPFVGGQLVKVNTPPPRERSQGTEIVRNSGGLTQRQLFSELQHVVVQLSQTALGDQQRISDLTQKIKAYEALLSDQEKMIEELEELNVRLVAERQSQQSLRLANGERAPAHEDDNFMDPFGGVVDRGGFSNQRTIITTMIQNIKEEKRQRLLVEEKSSKIIAEQQLAIHRLEQQLKDPQHGSHHLSSTTSLHRKQGGDSLPSHLHQGTGGVSIEVAENATSAQGRRGDFGPTSSQTADGPRGIALAHANPTDEVFQHEPPLESSGDAAKAKLDDAGAETRDLGDEARHAFALALLKAGVDASFPIEKSRDSEVNSGSAEDCITREDDYSIPLSNECCTGSASSQPHIPRLSLIPRTASSAQPSYTVAPQAGRSASSRALSDTRSDSVASSARTHSVVAMSDIDEDASKTQNEPSPSIHRVDRENTCDLAHRSGGIEKSHDPVAVVSVSMSRSQANVHTLASGAAILEKEQSTTPFREQLQRHVRTMLLECESTELPKRDSSQKGASTNCENLSDVRESKEGDNARASPDPYDYSHTVSALHTARSANSQGSARSSFLRHTSVAGASLGPASPPRGVIGQATAMDKILEDIKRRHNL